MAGEGLHIGAAVPCARIYSHAAVKKRYPIIASACALIGDVKIQNRAGMGGNFCNAAPSADTAPPVIVLFRQLHHRSPQEWACDAPQDSR